MDCAQARQLFDAYLDGELSPHLATELGAHRVRCPECRRALALMEVTGHIIASDDEPVLLGGRFEERLLACMEAPEVRRGWRSRRMLYIGGPLAVAAAITLAFTGVFHSRPDRVLGAKDFAVEGMASESAFSDTDPLAEAFAPKAQEGRTGEFERSLEPFRDSLAKKGDSVESLTQFIDMTIYQMMDVLDKAADESRGSDHFPGADSTTSPPGESAVSSETGVEED